MMFCTRSRLMSERPWQTALADHCIKKPLKNLRWSYWRLTWRQNCFDMHHWPLGRSEKFHFEQFEIEGGSLKCMRNENCHQDAAGGGWVGGGGGGHSIPSPPPAACDRGARTFPGFTRHLVSAWTCSECKTSWHLQIEITSWWSGFWLFVLQLIKEAKNYP